MAVLIGAAKALFAGGFFKTVVGRILLSVALGAVQSRLAKLQAKKNAAANAGIRSEQTLSGSRNPIGFTLGRYAVGGQLIAPEYAHGSNNVYNTYPISLGFIRGQTLNRVIVNGEVVELAGTSHATFGRNVLGKYANLMWVKYVDGSQTVVDPLMTSVAGSHPQRPWSSDMIGRETCIVYVTVKYDQDVFSSKPAFRFDINGIPLYDVRMDTTAGGTGPQRWADKATWQQTLNPVVMIYNILRGIDVIGVGKWGGEADAEDFRFSEWAAAMNKADTPLSGDTVARYQAGYEVFLSDEPSEVIAELLRACGGEIADVGGIWRISVGHPDTPVFFFEDADVIITSDATFDPFPGIGDTYNTVFATYVDPNAIWETTEAPMQTDASYLTEDDNRQLSVDLALPTVFRASQAQDLASTLLADNRRFRSHALPLPPAAMILEPLDSVSWTSDENGYSSKLFEVEQVTVNLMASMPQVSIRERDPSDYSFALVDVVPFVPVSTVRPPSTAALQSLLVLPFSISDGVADRRPAIRLTWDGNLASFATGIEYEVRTLTGSVMVVEGSGGSPASGNAIVSEGILPSTSYEVRAKLVAEGYDCPWSDWQLVITGALFIAGVDLADDSVTSAKLAVTIQSDDFAAGSAGWQITKTGDAEFNSLQVRSDMIVAGAVSREGPLVDSDFYYFREGQTFILPGTQITFDPADYDYISGSNVRNPVVFDWSAAIQYEGAGFIVPRFSVVTRLLGSTGAWEYAGPNPLVASVYADVRVTSGSFSYRGSVILRTDWASTTDAQYAVMVESSDNAHFVVYDFNGSLRQISR